MAKKQKKVKEVKKPVVTPNDLSAYQKCLRDHAGECGTCHQDGTFTACP